MFTQCGPAGWETGEQLSALERCSHREIGTKFSQSNESVNCCFPETAAAGMPARFKKVVQRFIN